jgi:hypothetical protein
VFYGLTISVFVGWLLLIINIDDLLYQNRLITENSLFSHVKQDVRDNYVKTEEAYQVLFLYWLAIA